MIFRYRLGNNEAIKGIAVVVIKGEEGLQMPKLNWKNFYL
jgi:hypothetical protein